jgi:hypothetical protein
MQEEWKIIEGVLSRYGKPYFVSNLGRFKNPYGRLMSFHKNQKGYPSVELPRNGKPVRISAHRIVATHFIPNPDNKPQVNHIDCNKKNNHVDNLEWCTNEENRRHAMNNGLHFSHKQGPRRKHKPKKTFFYGGLNEAAINEIKSTLIHSKFTRKMLGDKFGVSVHVVKDIRLGKSYANIVTE